jgi:hypothetical protein
MPPFQLNGDNAGIHAEKLCGNYYWEKDLGSFIRNDEHLKIAEIQLITHG